MLNTDIQEEVWKTLGRLFCRAQPTSTIICTVQPVGSDQQELRRISLWNGEPHFFAYRGHATCQEKCQKLKMGAVAFSLAILLLCHKMLMWSLIWQIGLRWKLWSRQISKLAIEYSIPFEELQIDVETAKTWCEEAVVEYSVWNHAPKNCGTCFCTSSYDSSQVIQMKKFNHNEAHHDRFWQIAQLLGRRNKLNSIFEVETTNDDGQTVLVQENIYVKECAQ